MKRTEEDKKIIGYLIRSARIKKNMTQAELAKAAGYTSESSSTTIAKIESGVNDIPSGKLLIFAKVLGLDPMCLVTPTLRDVGKEAIGYTIAEHTKNTIPLIGEIACGTPILAEDNIIEMLPPLPGVSADMALVCDGDSMQDVGIYNGDIAYIKLQPIVSNGDICAVRIGDSATLKRYSFDGFKMILHPENKKYQDLVYQGTALADVKILGKLVGVVRRF